MDLPFRTFEDIESREVSHKSKDGNTASSYLSHQVFKRSDMKKMMDCSSLDLSHNAIESLKGNIFKHNENLESLNLDNNQLKTLPEKIFDGLVMLENISIKWNLLELLPEDLFKFNKKLKSVDLSHNKLSRIPPETLNDLPRLSFASFNDNICVDSTFPEECLEDLNFKIAARCGETNLKTFVASLVQILLHHQDGRFHASSNDSEHVTKVGIKSSTWKATVEQEATESVTTEATNSSSASEDLETLIVSLFWLIIPITLILFVILAMIFYVIYNKYLVYYFRAERRW